MGITNEQLVDLKKLAEDADQYASNNWYAYQNEGPDEEDGAFVMDSTDSGDSSGWICTTDRPFPIAEFIAAANPQTVLDLIAEIERLRVPFLFAGSRDAAEYFTWSLLRQYLEGARKRLSAIVKAHEAA